MSVLETGSGRGEQGFDKLRLAELAKKAECISTDIFVGVLEIVSDTVTFGEEINESDY